MSKGVSQAVSKRYVLDGWTRLGVAPEELIRTSGRNVSLVIPILLVGIASLMDQTETRALMGRGSGLASDWFETWATILVVGPITGIIGYYIGGWFNSVRVAFVSDAKTDHSFCRRVAVLTSLFSAVPTIVGWIAATVRFDTPQQYLASDVAFMAPVFFGAWGSFATYTTLREEYGLRGRWTTFWFLALPLSVYAIVMFGTMSYVLYIVSSA